MIGLLHLDFLNSWMGMGVGGWVDGWTGRGGVGGCDGANGRQYQHFRLESSAPCLSACLRTAGSTHIARSSHSLLLASPNSATLPMANSIAAIALARIFALATLALALGAALRDLEGL